MTSLISIRGLRKTYRMGDENVHALAGVDLDFAADEDEDFDRPMIF